VRPAVIVRSRPLESAWRVAQLAHGWRAVSEDTRAVASDGLPARLIKPHTLEKFDYHDRYCGIVAVGMPGSWGGNVGYLELMAGSGIAMNAETLCLLRGTCAASSMRGGINRSVIGGNHAEQAGA
jgi:hypothetical protein